MLNFSDEKKYFKIRFYSMAALLLFGVFLFVIWSVLFFTEQNSKILDIIHIFGLLYFLLALLLGILIYAAILGTVIYKYKELKNDKNFRSAFLKFTGLMLLSVSISFGMAKFVTHSVSRMVISIVNMSNKHIDKIAIVYPYDGLKELRNLKIGQKESRVIFPRGEGPLTVKVVFADGAEKEETVIGYVSQKIYRVPYVELRVTNDHIQSVERKK